MIIFKTMLKVKLHVHRKFIIESLQFFFPLQVNFFYFLLSLVALGLCWCMWAFSSCNKLGLLSIVVCRLLVVVASLAVENRL